MAWTMGPMIPMTARMKKVHRRPSLAMGNGATCERGLASQSSHLIVEEQRDLSYGATEHHTNNTHRGPNTGLTGIQLIDNGAINLLDPGITIVIVEARCSEDHTPPTVVIT